jgi:DNA-binding transcriptional MocR family regulator
MSIQYQPVGRNAKEISGSVEEGIRGGDLTPGAQLPSVRALAARLGVAPGTVAAAYRALRERGLVESAAGSGTRVRSRPALAPRSTSPPVDSDLVDLASGQPDPRLLPVLPARAKAERRRAGAPRVPVVPELLEAGRARLAADDVPAGAVTLSSGGLDGIDRVLSAHLRPGDRVAVEDPGWPNALDLVATLGLRPVPVALDEQGPRPESLLAVLRAGVRAVIITSRAHNPTGACVTRARASALSSVLAQHRQTLLIEDDHAAELAGVELACLAGTTDSWAFIRSTSKPYGPDLRVALVAGDEATIARVEGRMRVSPGWVSTMLQRLVLELWTSSHASSTVARAAETYSARRRHLIAELRARGIDSTGDTGLNVWIPVPDETVTVTSLLSAGWAVAPGARFRQASPPGVRVTVSGLTTSLVPALAADVATAMAVTPAGRSTR